MLNGISSVLCTVRCSAGGDDGGADVHGMTNLMIAELVFCVVPLILAFLFFRDAPPTPPSHSTSLKIEVSLRCLALCAAA